MTDADKSPHLTASQIVPEGFDAICASCNYPYVFLNAEQCGVSRDEPYCCSLCRDGEPRKKVTHLALPVGFVLALKSRDFHLTRRAHIYGYWI